MKYQRLKEILDTIPKLRIAVVGDFFLDKWLEIDRSLDEASIETGLTAYQVIAKRCYAGAAGTVLNNLAALETGTLYAVGFLGEDGEGYEMLRALKNIGVNTSSLFTSDKVMTPTYTKPVFIRKDGIEETHRLDHRNTKPTPLDVEQKIIDALWKIAPEVDALIALDQLTHEGCGVLTPRVRQELAKLGDKYPKLILYADSRAFIKHFQNMIIKCNNNEALKLFSASEDYSVNEEINKEVPNKSNLAEIEKCLLSFAAFTGKPVFITCGPEGVMVQDQKGKPVLVPGIVLPPDIKIDIVGAGDACTSGIVTALCCGGTLQEAAFIGNLVASITIQIIGTTGTATRKEVLSRHDKYFGSA